MGEISMCLPQDDNDDDDDDDNYDDWKIKSDSEAVGWQKVHLNGETALHSLTPCLADCVPFDLRGHSIKLVELPTQIGLVAY